MAYAQKPDFVFRRNGRVHLNRRGRQFSRLAAEVCASAVVMLDTPCCEVVWRVLATHSIRQFPLHFRPPTPCVTVCHHMSTGLYVLTMGPDTSETCRGWRNILVYKLYIKLVFFTLLYRDARPITHLKTYITILSLKIFNNLPIQYCCPCTPPPFPALKKIYSSFWRWKQRSPLTCSVHFMHC